MHEVNPYIFTVATLTGHVIRCYGDNYTSVLDNGPAWRDGVSRKIAEAGDVAGEPCEVSYRGTRNLVLKTNFCTRQTIVRIAGDAPAQGRLRVHLTTERVRRRNPVGRQAFHHDQPRTPVPRRLPQPRFRHGQARQQLGQATAIHAHGHRWFVESLPWCANRSSNRGAGARIRDLVNTYSNKHTRRQSNHRILFRLNKYK